MPRALLNKSLRKKQSEFLAALHGLLPQGIRNHPSHPPYFSGYQYETLYDWDQYFDGILLCYCGYPMDYLRNGIRIFVSLQREDGFIPRSFHPANGVHYKHDVMFKPFLAQLALLTIHQDAQVEWLVKEGIYDRLKRYYRCWTEKYDVRGEGLSVWHDAAHTGMDNHEMRAGSWDGPNRRCEGVDLNSYLVREGRALALLAEMIGRGDDAKHFRGVAEKIGAAMRRWLWNDEEGFFFDYDVQEGRPMPTKYVGAFAPLWAGVSTSRQARRIVMEHLLDTREFWRPHPLPALAATEPGYAEGFLPDESTSCCNWRANTWMPTNYYVFQGLRNYGYKAAAAQLALKSFTLFDRGRFCEYYTSESGVGTGLKPFWGWSALAIFMGTEYGLEADPTRLAGKNDAAARVAAVLG